MIHLISTGGTLDKDVHPKTSSLDFVQSQVAVALRTAALLDSQICHQELMMLDSLDLREEHRHQIAEAAVAAQSLRLIITHGTDTLTQTAEFLSRREDLQGKTIVLTGAMRPLSMAISDGPFNLGMAYAAAKLLPPGIYTALSGEVLPWTQLRKDRERGRFLRTSDAPESTAENKTA